MSVYRCTNAGLRNLVRSWIEDIRGSGIRINVVNPGPVRPQSLYDVFPDDKRNEMFTYLKSRTTVGRLGNPRIIDAKAKMLFRPDSGPGVAQRL